MPQKMPKAMPKTVLIMVPRLIKATVLLAALALPAHALMAMPLAVQFSAEEVEFKGMKLEQVNVQLQDQAITLSAVKASLAEQPELVLRAIRLQCAEPGDAILGWCPSGEWQTQVSSTNPGWEQQLKGTISSVQWSERNHQVSSSLKAGLFTAALVYVETDSGPEVRLDWRNQSLVNVPFRGLLPAQLDWVKAGKNSAVLKVELGTVKADDASSKTSRSAGSRPAIKVHYDLKLQDVSLDSPEGRFAAEGLNLQALGTWKFGSTQKIDIDAKFLAGEVLADSFYTAFGPQVLSLNAQLELTGDQLKVKALKLSDDGSIVLQASASLNLQDPIKTLRYRVKDLHMQFPAAYERYLEPVLASATLDQLSVVGGFQWTGSGEGSDFPNGTLVFDELSVVDQRRGRFAFTGMSAQVQVGASQGLSEFSWRGLLLGRINLGAGKIDLKTAPGLFELAQPLNLHVLGGKFVVDEFSLQLPAAGTDAEPVVNFNAGLNAMDMEQLTAALGWPTFAGKISGQIPGASFNQGVLTVDGLLSFEAFDGRIQLSQLRVERLFGVLPSLAADLEIQDLDLQLLTSAFEFGRIAGRLDGYVRDLRMLDWSPVSFDAWIGTPARQADSKQISRQAVNSLTSIGGGGATAALTGPLMRMFSNFSYRRLGMGCKLENYVCSIRGLQDEDNSAVIMEGSGVPKLMIKVFNRQMDFPQLMANLSTASSGEDIRIGDP